MAVCSETVETLSSARDGEAGSGNLFIAFLSSLLPSAVTPRAEGPHTIAQNTKNEFHEVRTMRLCLWLNWLS
jgi:hypothetical protein